MLGKLIPVFLALAGAAGGIGAGIVLRPAPEAVVEIHPCGPEDASEKNPDSHKTENTGGEESDVFDYVKLNNQFVVPVVREGKVASLVVLSLSLEVLPGQTDQIYSRQPRLRDAFLQVLLDHANGGGFDGEFTNGEAMVVLRSALKEIGIKVGGSPVSDVLILEIVRQDV